MPRGTILLRTTDPLVVAMRRRDQAKLFFLCALRSNATTRSASAEAFAIESTPRFASCLPPTTISPPPVAVADPPSPLSGHISLRIARRSDVPGIQRCNLATLPENYNSMFYSDHLTTHPDLAFVVEHVPPGCDPLSGARGTPGPLMNGSGVVGYVLGKIEKKTTPVAVVDAPPTTTTSLLLEDCDDELSLESYLSRTKTMKSKTVQKTEALGHVTSLAVLSSYRRLGLGKVLMDTLHNAMASSYRANAVGLHVRVSNEPAAALYKHGMGYEVTDVVGGYYKDGEDAYFMKKELRGGGARSLRDAEEGEDEPTVAMAGAM